MSTVIDKYLKGYAEPEVNLLESFPSNLNFINAVVIPAYNETYHFISRLSDCELTSKKNLFIIVVNQPDSETNSIPQHQLVENILQHTAFIWSNKNLSLVQFNQGAASLLVVDRFSEHLTIGDEYGVGLARKIGADIATQLIHNNIIQSPWIGSTDADAELPNNYFSSLPSLDQQCSAVTYNFKHRQGDDEISQATSLYETALRYYVSGLKFACSSYAYHSIGSSLAVHYNYYAMARGFPKKAGGEDFYLLNKLAKLSKIQYIKVATIRIEARLSTRVPFGTGPAVSKIMSLTNPSQDYRYYHPQLFVELKNTLMALENLWHHLEQLEPWFKQLSNSAVYGLEQLQFHKLIIHLKKQCSTEQQCHQQLTTWFDAFKTLKFLHHLQDHSYPKIPLHQAISQAAFTIN